MTELAVNCLPVMLPIDKIDQYFYLLEQMSRVHGKILELPFFVKNSVNSAAVNLKIVRSIFSLNVDQECQVG